MDKKCLSEGIIYQATVTEPTAEPRTYIGLCSTDFKKRLGVHRDAFKNPDKLSIQISLTLPGRGTDSVDWRGGAHWALDPREMIPKC